MPDFDLSGLNTGFKTHSTRQSERSKSLKRLRRLENMQTQKLIDYNQTRVINTNLRFLDPTTASIVREDEI